MHMYSADYDATTGCPLIHPSVYTSVCCW